MLPPHWWARRRRHSRLPSCIFAPTPDGTRIPGVSTYDAAFTGPAGIESQLGTGTRAEVGFATLGPLADQPSYKGYRRSPNRKALLTMTNEVGRGLPFSTRNASWRPTGFPI